MQAEAILQNLLDDTCVGMHATRRAALEAMVWSGLRGRRLTTTGLGRALAGPAREKHHIKRADRLLSNVQLQHERAGIYGALIRRLVGGQRHPVVLIDWSDLDEWKRHQLLRVSLVVESRSITLYEEVHGPETALKRATLVAYLKRFQSLLPSGCEPVMVSDAGFCTPWFEAVEQLGWYWVSRTRGRRYLKGCETAEWVTVKSLHTQATARAKYYGEVLLTRSRAHRCQLVLYKSKALGRHQVNHNGARSRSHKSTKAARSAREPWVLATNLPRGSKFATKVVKIYRLRMQIEESFRDVKSVRFGLGMAHHRSYKAARLAILLLIAALAMMVLWLMGLSARERGLMRHYQANTVRHRAVLSVVYLGLRIIERAQDHFTAAHVRAAWKTIAQIANSAAWTHDR